MMKEAMLVEESKTKAPTTIGPRKEPELGLGLGLGFGFGLGLGLGLRMNLN